MPMPDPADLTERQARWFQSVRTGLERDTGRTIDQWADIARTCPEQAHRKRLIWMKTNHGLGQNHASLVLNAAFPPAASWSNPALLTQALWTTPESTRLFEAVSAAITTLPDVIIGQRKSFTAFSHKVQFAAARPIKAGGLQLGLALEPSCAPRLIATGRESWSERLKSTLPITRQDQIDDEFLTLIRQAWDRS
jgi:hypothetical protein